MKKVAPLITCEISLSQNVCELVFGVNVTDLSLGVQINPVKQGSWNMPHCGTSTFDHHFDYCLIVLKDIQSIGTRMCHAWWNLSLLDRDVCEFDCACLAEHLPTGFAVALSHLWLCWFGVVRNEILQSLNSKDRERGIPSMRKPASRENYFSFRGTVCNWGLFLAHPSPDVDFESSKSPAKSESWSNPNLHCCAVFPTQQYCWYSHVWWM